MLNSGGLSGCVTGVLVKDQKSSDYRGTLTQKQVCRQEKCISKYCGDYNSKACMQTGKMYW
jgi:hypothetical protein